MVDENGHCITTCQLHTDTRSTIEKHSNVLYGDDSEGGLIAKVNRIIDTLDTIKKLVYGLVGLALVGVATTIGKVIMTHGITG